MSGEQQLAGSNRDLLATAQVVTFMALPENDSPEAPLAQVLAASLASVEGYTVPALALASEQAYTAGVRIYDGGKCADMDTALGHDYSAAAAAGEATSPLACFMLHASWLMTHDS